MRALDLFAGPGGWDLGAKDLGIDPLGIEWDDAACQTRDAAGLRTVKADVSELTPQDYAPCDLLIASPPCWADPRSRLVTEPLRWALALRPTYLAWEQVPPVLDYWKFCAEILRSEGYSVWTGILSAERYGVPQTRKRAILMGSLAGPVEPPAPTHQAYVSGEPAWDEPMHSLEGELKPWVSMAEALGWDAEIPAPTVTGGGTDTGGPEIFGRGGAYPNLPSYRRTRGSGMNERNGERRDHPAQEPAPTLTGKARSDKWVYVNGNQENVAVRGEEEPAPTLLFGHRMNDVRWMRERGHKKDEANPDSPGRMEDAVRVTVAEASALQSFPPDYPWQGSRSKQFQQIGNAFPPKMAREVLGALLAAEELEAAA